MGFKSVLKPDSSVTVGLAEAAAVYVIYQSALPNHADIRAADPHNRDIESARKGAAWKAAGILGFVFLITQDLNSFLIGGLALAGIDYMTKHANGISPATGKLAPGGSIVTLDASGAAAAAAGGANAAAFPLPSYGDQAPAAY